MQCFSGGEVGGDIPVYEDVIYPAARIERGVLPGVGSGVVGVF